MFGTLRQVLTSYFVLNSTNAWVASDAIQALSTGFPKGSPLFSNILLMQSTSSSTVTSSGRLVTTSHLSRFSGYFSDIILIDSKIVDVFAKLIFIVLAALAASRCISKSFGGESNLNALLSFLYPPPLLSLNQFYWSFYHSLSPPILFLFLSQEWLEELLFE